MHRSKSLSVSAMTLLAFAALAVADDAPAGAPAASPAPSASSSHAGRVSVTGTGEILVAPNIAVFTVEASNTEKSPIGASADTRKAMNSIVLAARKFAPNPGDLRTTRISIQPEYEWPEGKRKFRGYTASQTLEVTVRDLTKLDSLLEAVNRTSFTTMGNLEFRHSKADSLQREARSLAIRNAAVNASGLCAAAGRTCDELIGARAGGAQGVGPFPAPMAEMRAFKAAGGSAMPVLPGVLVFSEVVEADYKLK
jgi:uncharacterized protein YggE